MTTDSAKAALRAPREWDDALAGGALLPLSIVYPPRGPLAHRLKRAITEGPRIGCFSNRPCAPNCVSAFHAAASVKIITKSAGK